MSHRRRQLITVSTGNVERDNLRSPLSLGIDCMKESRGCVGNLRMKTGSQYPVNDLISMFQNLTCPGVENSILKRHLVGFQLQILNDLPVHER